MGLGKRLGLANTMVLIQVKDQVQSLSNSTRVGTRSVGIGQGLSRFGRT